jgi:hypothetical protein
MAIETKSVLQKFWHLFAVRLFVVAFLLRLLFGACVCIQGRVVELDSHDYLILAQNLRDTATFARDSAGQVPDLKRTPLYPIFLVLSGGSGKLPYVPLLLQSLLGAGSCLFLLEIARTLEFTDRVCRLGSWMLAFDPLSISYSAVLLSETLFAFLIAGWFLFFVRTWSGRPGKVLAPAITGLVGLAILTRPIGLFLIAPTLLALACNGRAKATPWLWLILGLVLGLLPPGAWLLRNYYHSGGLVLTTIGATNLLDYRAAGVKARVENRPFLQAREILRNKYGADDPRQPPRQARQAASLKTRKAIELLRGHPGVAFKQSARGLGVMLFLPGAGSILKSSGLHEGGTGIYSALSTFDTGSLQGIWRKLRVRLLPILSVTILCSLYLLIAYGSLVLGLYRSFYDRGLRHRLFGILLLAALLIVPAAGPESEPRFRVPIMIFLALAAAPGLTRCLDWLRNLRDSSSSEL